MTSLWELFTPSLVSDENFLFFKVQLRESALAPRCLCVNAASVSRRCAVGGGKRDPALRGLQEEVLPEARRVFCGQPGHQ